MVYNNQAIPPVAQLDNATDSDSGDRGFKSLRADQITGEYFKRVLPLLFGLLSIRRDLKASVKKTCRWHVFSESVAETHSCAHTATSEHEVLKSRNVLRADQITGEYSTKVLPLLFCLLSIRRDLKASVEKSFHPELFPYLGDPSTALGMTAFLKIMTVLGEQGDFWVYAVVSKISSKSGLVIFLT